MKREIGLSLGTLVAGLVLEGFAWTTKLSEPLPTISLVAGLVMSVAGFIATIYLIKRRNEG